MFLSHSRWDHVYARALADQLESAGVRTWIAGPTRHARGWWDDVSVNLECAAAVMVLMTEHSRCAAGVRQEVDEARRTGKPLIPILLSGDPFLLEPAEDVRGGTLPSDGLIRRVKLLCVS
ncbi:toll/interleukin-1 receptor domain-containing protein [Catellatospora sp. KI3]|uniref:toll/interleukin-1 receptor domain-containing protein n=1 Tax=Catellatospora sp. KI3 TaxID=3041620 RepID=UPI002482B54D|nr:toll/interleukin-1 receptor domain-containing protein [Catellatospora sp. KI3]MDI1461020.1 toll/interleukin-1 receptor domain-containing protein [Catellatospora sp. KI3]